MGERDEPRQLEAYAPTARADWQSAPEDEPSSAPVDPPARSWRGALRRWLLTLNPGRTQDEYEKAVRYFFETPGAPQDLAVLTPDLLLAYRGALANRADRRRRSAPRRKTTFADRLAPQSGPFASPTAGASDAALGNGAPGDKGRASAAIPAAQRKGPLSPATVNIRLTALRQYLLFAHDQEPLPALSAERIRSALRRLTNERRRPYQILAEDEWEAFLRAALGQQPQSPRASATPAPEPSPVVPAPSRSVPWGKTRAEREQDRLASAATQASELPGEQADDAPVGPSADVPRAAGATRTGAFTAQRDHALISLALATGLRAIELSLLDVSDLVSERRHGALEWWLVLPDEKTKGQRGGRTLPLAPELAATLHDYIQATGRRWDDPRQRATPLFLALTRGRYPQSATGAGAGGQAVATHRAADTPAYRRLRPEQIRGVIHRVERQWLAQQESAPEDDGAAPLVPGGRRLSPHALRHSAAIALLLGDETSERPPASVEHVRGWLGHFDIRTTQRYLAHIESRDQRRRFAIRPSQRRRVDTPDQPPAQDDGA